MTNKNAASASSRRRFLSAAGIGALLALGAGAQAMQVRARQAQSVSPDDLRAFTQGFAVLIDRGMSLVESFDTLAAHQSNAAFGAVLRQIRDGLAEGATLSKEMARFPDIFNDAYIAVIREGEYHGTLEESAYQLAHTA